MKIAVLEHFTSLSPPSRRADDPKAEGRAIRDAAVADLSRLPGAEVIVVTRRSAFGAALRSAEAVLIVAPEEEGILERLCRRVERRGLLLLGPSSAGAGLMADKLATARVLAAAGVPTPRTRSLPLARARRLLRARRPPFVLKPRDGCGGRGVVLVRRPRDLDQGIAMVRKSTRRDDLLVQDYVPGRPASVSIIVSAAPLDLGLNLQRLRRGRRFAYAGGETFWPHPLSDRARAAARAAVEALARARPGVRGYLGVDLVLGAHGVSVIEVNPRLTTSYVGLRLSVQENIGALILDAAAGRALPDRIRPIGRCWFDPKGAVRMLEKTWRSSAAGTSAASI